MNGRGGDGWRAEFASISLVQWLGGDAALAIGGIVSILRCLLFATWDRFWRDARADRIVMSTIFSKIVAGELPADIVFQDERVTAFRDINPAAPTHLLVIPNREIPTVDDIPDDEAALIGHMVLTAKRLAREEGIADSGYRLIINCKDDGHQEVAHLHLHLLGGRDMGPMVMRKA